MATATEAKSFTGLSSSTAVFGLRGGKYAVAAVATWGGGSAKLQTVGPDGTTTLSVNSATDFSANGYAVVDLPPGQYQFVIATATAVAASVCRIPT